LSNYTFGLPGEAEERSVLALGYASLYNHKDNCNCDYLINEKVIKIFALRDIAKDEELFIFYGEDWAEGRDIPNWVK
jgi:SET domain-containing protein